ncbi:MAG TPA: efflux RND transporter permease subunit [Marinobacter sp.]|uniref:Efflux RND transporter permease subunit n=2 Tax=root TaxID=1 RepID=A0A831R4W7_9GAMM|nr:CusA/CzcA family heavy metal efflux RND transporter [Marinobacter antarcticus]HDZ37448.1 efflux RND transporter permease subunit [Marinobacter sp.]HEA53165.1 efflux RND transporter permease subunit [Marinobacter antarcticus]
MIASLIRFALIQRLMILLLAGALSVAGLWAFRTLPIDAFPDIASPQVSIIIKAPGLAPTEVESRITFPIEMGMQGLPRQVVLRSMTKNALSIVTIDFEDGVDIYWARQQVTERLNQVWSELPDGVEGGLGPVTTPLGEGYMYRVQGVGYSNQELRRIQDWVIRPRLRSVAGVAEVNSLGGDVKVFEVVANQDALMAYGLSINDLQATLENNNRNAGGGRINRNNEVLLVRTEGQLSGLKDIRSITVTSRNGTPVHVDDIADVRINSLTRYGAVTADAQGEVVTGLVLLRKGANSRSTIDGVKKEIDAMQSALPQGVELVPFYDRTDLVSAAVWTVEKALGEAVILVLLVLIVMLGNLRAALTVALILPLSVLFTFIMMRLFGVPANLMSLGGLAIAIGILVDAAVVVVENIHSQLNRAPKGVSRLHLVYRATLEVATPVISGILIIIVVFLPLFSLSGLEGKMFTPLAVTISFALVASLLLSLTVIPVLASLLMKGGAEKEGRVSGALKHAYLPVMNWALSQRKLAIAVALGALVVAMIMYPFIGKEFMPVMDEGTTVVIIEKLPSVSLERSLELDAPFQKAMMELPEVTGVVSRTGADELRLDPMGLYQTDNILITKPRSEWTVSLEEHQENLRKKLDQFIGIDYAFTQPIDMRVSEMLTGVRAAMAIKLYGDDLSVLEEKSKQIKALVNNVPGAVDVFRGQLSGQSYLEINIRPQAIARFGINNEDINQLIEVAVGGRVVTEVIEGNQRIGVLLRYPEEARFSPVAIGSLFVESPNGNKIPLSSLADIQEVDGPVAITRESAKRQVVIQSNVDGRDVVSFVDEVRESIERNITLPPGYYVTFGGQFENQQRASARLVLVVPIAIALIFLMLFITFRSLGQASLIILNIPFAMIGGVVSLFVSGLYLSVPASVGFITLFGVAVLNGVVMVTYFNQLRESGRSIIQAVQEGAERRLMPVLMTALIASFGLMPLLFATGPGSELQRPLAVVVIGGLFSSTVLTLVLLPTLYAWLEGRAEARLHTDKEVMV